MAQDGQAHDLILLQQLDAAHAGTIATGEHANRFVGELEADAAAFAGCQQRVVALPACCHTDQLVALIQLHRDQAGGADVAEIGQAVAADVAGHGGEHEMQALPQGFVLRQRQHRGDFVRTQFGQHVHQRAALRRRAGLRQLPHPDAERFAA